MDLRYTTLGLVLAVLLLVSNIDTAYSQAYHFSNGWFPGRKRSLDAYSSVQKRMESTLQASIQECQIRPQIQQLVTDLLQVSVVLTVSSDSALIAKY